MNQTWSGHRSPPRPNRFSPTQTDPLQPRRALLWTGLRRRAVDCKHDAYAHVGPMNGKSRETGSSDRAVERTSLHGPQHLCGHVCGPQWEFAFMATPHASHLLSVARGGAECEALRRFAQREIRARSQPRDFLHSRSSQWRNRATPTPQPRVHLVMAGFQKSALYDRAAVRNPLAPPQMLPGHGGPSPQISLSWPLQA